jgi:hypothetical protein
MSAERNVDDLISSISQGCAPNAFLLLGPSTEWRRRRGQMVLEPMVAGVFRCGWRQKGVLHC